MISFFARHPTAANLLMLVFLAIGILTVRKLRRETFPDFSPTEVEIRIVYPGATAEEVEESICRRVEDALDQVRYVRELRSEARDGVGVVIVEMDPAGRYQEFKDEIDTAVGAIDDLPPEAEDPVITQLHTVDLVLALLVTGPMAPSDLKAYCEGLKERLQQQPEVSLVAIEGFSDHQLRVELREQALRRYRLNADQVANIIQRQSLNLPAGAIETRQGEISIRFVEERRTPEALEDLIILGDEGGAEVRLRDIASVIDVFELDEEKVLLGDRRAGLLSVYMTKNQDVLRVANAVKTFVRQERKRNPQIDIRITQDSSTLVRDRLVLLINNAWQGGLLVMLAMWMFFSFRLSFWVVMSLPVSFLGAFFFMPYLGLTINMMTMVGLLLALGLLMDDGIVIAENIATHASRGKPPLEAAVDGVREVKGGVFSSFITTVCVLGPLAFLQGDIGKVLEVVPMTLILVLIVSLIEAFLILPAHLGHSLHHGNAAEAGWLRGRFDGAIDWVRERILGRMLDLLLQWRYLWIGTVAAAFLVAIGMLAGGVLKFQAFPDLDGDVIEARILLPSGTPLERTEQVVQRITDGLARVNERFRPLQPENRNLVETVFVRFNRNPDAFESGPHVATVTVDLLAAQERTGRLDDIFRAWRKEVGDPADVQSLSYTEPGFGPQGRSIEIRFQGDNLDDLNQAAVEAERWFARFPGVRNVSDDLHPGKREFRIRLREGAVGLGLDARVMASQLRAAFQGVTADEIQVGPESYEIDVRLEPSDRDSVADFEYFDFTLPDGSRVPIHAVAEVIPGRGWARVPRVNERRTVTVRGDVDPRVTNNANLMAEFQDDFVPRLASRFPKIDVVIEGEIREGKTTRLSILRGMLIGLLGVFILLSFQFRSYIEPLVVMVVIPLALIGVVAGHLIMGINLSMPSILGFVSLSGIVVNDSILLMLFLKMRRAEGADILQAASQASRQRFRAITITSLTTIAGLLPLLAEQSLQAQVLIPLATSIVFGLLASTILVLLVVPCLYAILGDSGLTDHRSAI